MKTLGMWAAVTLSGAALLMSGCTNGRSPGAVDSAQAAPAAPATVPPGFLQDAPMPEPGRTSVDEYNLNALPVEQGVLGYAPNPAPPITRKTPARVKVDLEVTERVGKLADGTEYLFWTFGDAVPGPMIRVREGDMVELTLMNHPDSRLPHNIDLHAVAGQGGGAEGTLVAPGEKKTITFRALKPGAYIYHCATQPVGMHIANGMYGLIVVDPKEGWPAVDKEFYVVQSEFYTEGNFGDPGLQNFDLDRALREDPGYVVFNGAAGSLVGDNALKANVGDNVRIFFGNGGPNLVSSFHVIGEIFDTVYVEAGSRTNHNVQTTLVPAGGATIVDFKIRVPATYILVDHSIFRAFNKGAIGMLVAEGKENPQYFEADGKASPYAPEGKGAKLEQPKAAQPEQNGAPDNRDKATRLADGEKLYKLHCSACHGATGDGVPNVFPSLKTSDLLNDTAEVVKSIVKGRQGDIGIMPPVPQLKDAEIADIISFAQSSFKGKDALHETAEISKIRSALK